MKKILKIIVVMVIFAMSVISCKKIQTGDDRIQKKYDLTTLDITIIDPIVGKDGIVVSKPMPINISGQIENFSIFNNSDKGKINMYILQQGDGELIYHIQSSVKIQHDGRFTGKAWFGNEKYGNGKNFEVSIILTIEKVLLQAGDNPVPDIPENFYTKKFIVKRVD